MPSATITLVLNINNNVTTAGLNSIGTPTSVSLPITVPVSVHLSEAVPTPGTVSEATTSAVTCLLYTSDAADD